MTRVQRAFRGISREIHPAILWIRGPRPQRARPNFLRKGETKHILKTGDRGLVSARRRGFRYRGENYGRRRVHHDRGNYVHPGRRRRVRPKGDFRNVGGSGEGHGLVRAELR